MKSMTGYGSATGQIDELEISIEATSVNRRALEVNVLLPKEWTKLERTITGAAKSCLDRGKVNIYLNAKAQGTASEICWDKPAIDTVMSNIRSYMNDAKLEFNPTPELLFNVAKTLGATGELPSADDVSDKIEDIVNEALKNLSNMRATEGLSLATDIKSRIQKLITNKTSIQEISQKVVPNYRELLLERLKNAGLEVDLNDERVLKEIALFADKCDTSEEITRLESHLTQFLNEMESEGPIGRKLDFLCQELNRELNTIGSKANDYEVTKLVIDSKNELERIREQAQNVE